MRTIPIELQTELLKEVTQAQHLITITTKSHTYRWTDGQNDIYYEGNWWISKGIEFDTIGSTVSGQLDSLTLEIDNVDQKFSDLVMTEDIRGSQCLIEIVYLDINQAIIGEPVILFQGFLDRMPMDGVKARVDVFSHMVRWKLMTPRRQHTPSCPWIFKGTECGYDGKIYRNPISDVMIEFTNSHLTYNYECVDDRLDDLSIGQVYTASSDNGAGYEVARAFNRVYSDFWMSNGTADPTWVKVQYAIACIINKIKFTQYQSSHSPFDLVFQGSQDDITWTDLLTVTGITWIGEIFKTFDFTNATPYFYYRLYMTRSHPSYGTAIRELELFGPPTVANDSDHNSTSAIGTITSQYPPAHSDTYVKATTKQNTLYWPYFSTDPAITLVGSRESHQWASEASVVTNQRFHIDLGIAKIITRILYHNSHTSGTESNAGAKNFTLWGSNSASAFAELTYGTDTDWTQLTTDQSTLDQHIASDEVDPKYITVTNDTYYRYYAFKFADNWGNTSYMGVRRIELQSGGEDSQAATDLFEISPITIAPDATDISVTVRVRAKEAIAESRTLTGWMKFDGIWYPSTPIYPTTTMANYDFVWSVNPDTSIAWTVADIALITGVGYSTGYDITETLITVSEVFLFVSSDVTSCDLSEDRCTALNNQDNFGGFSFISELQTKEYWWGSKQRIWSGGI